MTTLAKGLLSGVALAVLALPAFARDLTIDLTGEPSSLDPHMQWNPDSYYVYRNIFDNLVTRDNDGTIVPQIATDWDYASDTELVMTIRDDVVFHDGTPLTPEDVVFSVQRIIDWSSMPLRQSPKALGVSHGRHPILIAHPQLRSF